MKPSLIWEEKNEHSMIFTPTNHRIKDLEKEQIFKIIQKSYPISQKQMLGSYRIRPANLSKIIKELLADNMIILDSSINSHGRGRPELFFSPNNQRLVCISIIIDSWVIRAVIVDIGRNIIKEVSEIAPPNIKSEEMITLQLELLNELINSIDEHTETLGISICLPGNVDPESLVWKECQRWKSIQNIDYKVISKEIGIPISLYRDLDAALFNQLLINPNYIEELVILLHWGIGLGISFASRGRIITSNHGRFGTIGYMKSTPKESAGKEVPELEEITSLKGLIKSFRQKYPTLQLDEREIAQTVKNDPMLDISEFLTAIEYVGLAMRNLCMTLYPDRIFLLSPFCENPTILEALKRSFSKERIIDDLQEKIPIISLTDGYSGCINGSIHQTFDYGLKHYLKAKY